MTAQWTQLHVHVTTRDLLHRCREVAPANRFGTRPKLHEVLHAVLEDYYAARSLCARAQDDPKEPQP